MMKELKFYLSMLYGFISGIIISAGVLAIIFKTTQIKEVL